MADQKTVYAQLMAGAPIEHWIRENQATIDGETHTFWNGVSWLIRDVTRSNDRLNRYSIYFSDVLMMHYICPKNLTI